MNAAQTLNVSTYTTAKGNVTHVLSAPDAPQKFRVPACGQARGRRGNGYMNFAGVGTPTCAHCAEIAASRAK